MDKLNRRIAKILVALTIMWCIVGLNNNIVIAGEDDYIDWKSGVYMELLNLKDKPY